MLADAVQVFQSPERRLRNPVGDSVTADDAEGIRERAAGRHEETPKPGDPAFERTTNVLVGTNYQALLAGEARARALGYATLVLTSRLTGEAREAGLALLGIGEDIAVSGFPLRPPACVIAGGETTVTLRGKGKGGRNQEMALAFLAALPRSRADGIVFLAASTDGNDGPTDAAGAFASLEIAARARELGLDVNAALASNDSYRFHQSAGSLLRTGPTNTNVSDVAILLVGGAAAGESELRAGLGYYSGNVF